MPDTRTVATNVVVGVGDWQGTLAANQTAFANTWVDRPAFLARYPTSLSASQYVDNLMTTAGLTTGQVDRQAILTAMANSGGYPSTTARAIGLRGVIESSAFDIREKSPAFVLMQYFGTCGAIRMMLLTTTSLAITSG